MNVSAIADTIQGLVEAICRTTQAYAKAYTALWSIPFFDVSFSRTRTSSSRQVEELRQTIWNLRRLQQEALGEGMDIELGRALRALAEHETEIKRAVIVWIDLIEILVQDAERRHGSQPGRGALKAAEVKAAVQYLLRASRFDIPRVPAYLEPVVINIAVDWIIDAIVGTANRYDFWIDTSPQPRTFWSYLTDLRYWVQRITRPLWYPLVWLASRIWLGLRARQPLSPALRSALEAVERDGFIAEQGKILGRAVSVIVWIGRHRDQLMAGVELVFAVVLEAEGFLEMSGSEKKAYARNLILAVLVDLGFTKDEGLVFAIVDAVVDITIEAAVHEFNKRNVFTHKETG